MSNEVFFLDSSFILALELVDEQSHQLVLDCWQRLSLHSPKLITTSYVFDEVVTFLNSRNRHDRALVIGNRLLTSQTIWLIQVDERLFLEAWQFFQKHRDKSYSLTDCVSFLVMQQQTVEIALTLDRHFIQAGFQMLP